MENVQLGSDGVESELYIALETLVICLVFKISSSNTMSLLPLLTEVTLRFSLQAVQSNRNKTKAIVQNRWEIPWMDFAY